MWTSFSTFVLGTSVQSAAALTDEQGLLEPSTVEERLSSSGTEGASMIIVAGYLLVDPGQRADYLQGCVAVVEQARGAEGCLEYSLSADLVDPRRIAIFERWESQSAVEAFRGSGPSDEQNDAIEGASVAEYDISDVRSLT
jgi:quinol monooxygenase YgiN